MATPLAQPIRSTSFALRDVHVEGDADLGMVLDATPLYDSIGIWPAVKSSSGDVDVIWYETPSSFQTMALSASVSAAATTLNVTANYARVGDVIFITRGDTTGGTEYIVVTAVTAKQLTVTRDYNGSTGGILSATGTTLEVVGNVQPEGAAITVGISVAQNSNTNYFQIMHETYQLSGSAAAGTLYSGDEALSREQALALRRMNGKKNRALFHNVSATQMTSSTRGMAKGIKGWVTTNANAITSSTIGGTTTSTSLSWAKLNAWLWRLKTGGGSDQIAIFGGANAIKALRLAIQGGFTTYATVGTLARGGVAVLSFVSLHGQVCQFVYDSGIPTDTLCAIDIGQPELSGIWLVPAVGRELVVTPYVGNADIRGGNLVSEFSIMVKNETCHGILSAITTGG